MSNVQISALFSILVLVLLWLDLKIFCRVELGSFQAGVIRSAVWISLALGFNALVYFWRGRQPAMEFLAGYVLEESLSLDNVFVFVMIFTSTAVPVEHQNRVLFWGILDALLMRGILIAAGVALLSHFHWVLYLFGALLVWTGVRFLLRRREHIRVQDNPMLRLAQKIFPFTENYEGGAFFVRRNGRLYATPLLMVLIIVETTDVLFAMDSVPAIFSVTEDPFIVYTSNVFAVVGLRALYSLVAGAIPKFRHLRVGLSLVLIMVGLKMLIAQFYRISIELFLLIIFIILTSAVLLSLGGGAEPKPPTEVIKG